MKRLRLSAIASAAVILMATALAAGDADAHGARKKNPTTAPSPENKVERSAPWDSLARP
jgi:hypothetical protein